jgi:integrase
MNRTLTEQFIKKLGPPIKGSRSYFDGDPPGFGVRITANGVKTFIFDYRSRHAHRKYSIGQHPTWSVEAARKEARELKTVVDKGGDPQGEKNQIRSEPNFDDLAKDYRESKDFRGLGDRTRKDYGRMIDKIICPNVGTLRLGAIAKRNVDMLHASLKETPYQGNRVLAVLSAIFNFGMNDEKWKKWIVENPARGVKKFTEEKRENWLSVDQIQKFREALDAYQDQSAANCLRLLLLTGSRAGETLRAEWKEFDLTRGVWTKPSHHTKQKKTEYVPLSAPAIELLLSIRPRNATGPLFSGTKRRGKGGKLTGGGHRVSLKRPWMQACKAAGLVTVEMVKGKRKSKDGSPKMLKRYKPTVRLHDLRHSYASHLVSNGVGLQIVGKLLGHVQASTTMRYAHLQDEALRSATNQLAAIIDFQSKKTA